VPDKVRLWLSLSEDYDLGDDEEEEEGDSKAADKEVVAASATGEAMQKYRTARAAAGTLAGAVGMHIDVGKAMCAENCAKTMVRLLKSGKAELVHRALVIVVELLSCTETEPYQTQDPALKFVRDTSSTAASEEEQLMERVTEHSQAVALHLLEGGIVPAMAQVVKLGNMELGGLAREAAQLLSQLVKAKDDEVSGTIRHEQVEVLDS
jgi:hypothetical protein